MSQDFLRASRIKEWPELERPRERGLSQGFSYLSDAELISLLLETAPTPFSNSVELARFLLKKFDGIRGIRDAGINELLSIKGLGKAKIARLKASFELGLRVEERSKERFICASDVFRVYGSRLKGLKKEVFICLLLNSKKFKIKESIVSQGTLDSSLVHPREVFQDAVKEGASSIILIHNHPSGISVPSPEDYNVTKRMIEAGKILGIEVIDHVIIGDGEYYSFLDNGEIFS